ncbi:aldo/keto reductase [Endozoicomonas sp. OPT23]|uniref:aldo/keto reductase n=1 Tax=Endozoicomonas sp. OPT23 TaxID=2072845 RepID=UPI00129A3FAE|nr:aldo/keto reductase [Endozoicomonas sp. OPT23]MRI32767.1 aldo/keto reductase [Endozoicomonas sp. OPT23]
MNFPIQSYLPDASRMIYGCMGLGGGWNSNPVSNDDIQQAEKLIHLALESGINFFDHADIYTFGKAETAFGSVLKNTPSLRDRIILQSKCGIKLEDANGPQRYDLSAAWITSSVEDILKRLNTDYLEVLMLHRPDPLMEPEAIADVFYKLLAAGKVKHFAVSNMNQHQIQYLDSFLDQPLIANQLPMSLKEHDFVDDGILVGSKESSTTGFTPGLMEYSRLNKIQLQSWGSLAQGLFSGRDSSNESLPIQETAQRVHQLASEYQSSPEAIVLAWLMGHPAGIQPVVGTTHPDRLKASAQAVDVQLSRDHWYSLYQTARGKDLP